MVGPEDLIPTGSTGEEMSECITCPLDGPQPNSTTDDLYDIHAWEGEGGSSNV